MENPRDTALMRPADLLVAGAMLTRLPLPHAPDAAFARQAAASWAYPVIGGVLGLLAATIWALCGALGLPDMLTAGLTLAALTVMTGALHEDGLADTADGLWGGRDATRRLEIMKDSRIGSYGVLALIFGTGLRWTALTAAGPAALIAACALSRGMLPALMHAIPFARADGLARSVGAPTRQTAGMAVALALLVAALGLLLSTVGEAAQSRPGACRRQRVNERAQSPQHIIGDGRICHRKGATGKGAGKGIEADG